jgi:hypothetical protein
MSAFEAKSLDVGTGRFGDPQSVQRELGITEHGV